jgi:hypothetical protein
MELNIVLQRREIKFPKKECIMGDYPRCGIQLF